MEDLGKYVSIVYLVAGALLSWLFYRAFREVLLWLEMSDASLAAGVTPSMLAGIVLGGGVTAYLWNRADVRTFLGEVVEELSRVTWPTGEETRSSTIIVLVVAVLASFLVAIADYVWNGFTTLMLSI
ncbi:MAG: preprotein translocase subunit SecE [Myxococcales bacterium]|nr:preprotein translocase subunit SecE [Myxococcales bacterium]